MIENTDHSFPGLSIKGMCIVIYCIVMAFWKSCFYQVCPKYVGKMQNRMQWGRKYLEGNLQGQLNQNLVFQLFGEMHPNWLLLWPWEHCWRQLHLKNQISWHKILYQCAWTRLWRKSQWCWLTSRRTLIASGSYCRLASDSYSPEVCVSWRSAVTG